MIFGMEIRTEVYRGFEVKEQIAVELLLMVHTSELDMLLFDVRSKVGSWRVPLRDLDKYRR